MRRLALAALCILTALCSLAGCADKHPAPPDPLVAELRGGIVATLAAMGRPPLDERALTDEATHLAWSLDQQRLAAVRDGRVGADVLAAAGRGLVRRMRAAHAEPPLLLEWLVEHAEGLSLEQRILLQAMDERAAKEVPGGVKP
jgi:hypothetical protein